jgi:hypothetical protein
MQRALASGSSRRVLNDQDRRLVGIVVVNIDHATRALPKRDRVALSDGVRSS